jgi:hypothetical protein
MQVKYNRIVALVFFGLGLLNILLGGWLLLLGQFHFSLILGLLVGGIGFSYLTRPYFLVEGGAVVIPALLGPVRRTFDYGNKAERLKFEDGKLMFNNGTTWKRVPVQRWISDGATWEQFEQFVNKGG